MPRRYLGARFAIMPDKDATLTVTTFQAARRIWATSLVRGALFLVVGVVMFLWDDVALDLLAWLLAAVLVIQAVILLVEAQRLRSAEKSGQTWRAVLAVVAVVAAIVVLVWPHRSVTIVLRVIAVWALVAGIIDLAQSWRAYRDRRSQWSWELTTALLWIVFGGLVLVKPLDDLAVVTAVLSVYLVVTGIVLLVSGFALRVEAKDAQRASAAIEAVPPAGGDAI
jgi:hypothetical protein